MISSCKGTRSLGMEWRAHHPWQRKTLRLIVGHLLPVQRPDAAGLQQLVAPVGASLQAAQALTEGRRGPAFNHYKAAADALQSLSWVVYTGPNCGERCSARDDPAQNFAG